MLMTTAQAQAPAPQPYAHSPGHSPQPYAVSPPPMPKALRGVGVKPTDAPHAISDTGHNFRKGFYVGDLEDLCDRCGLCCHEKTQFSNGLVTINPFKHCDWLTEFGCVDYSNRKCKHIDVLNPPDRIFPDTCKYLPLMRRGAKAAIDLSWVVYIKLLKEERACRSKHVIS